MGGRRRAARESAKAQPPHNGFCQEVGAPLTIPAQEWQQVVMSYGDNGEAILMTEGGVKLSGVISFDLSVQAGARRGGEMSVRLVSGGFRP